MTIRERQYQDASLESLRPIVGETVINLIKDSLGHFGFRTGDGTLVWIMRDAEGNGPGFAEVVTLHPRSLRTKRRY